MITDNLKTILEDSGCTFIVYDQRELVNLYTDQSHQSDIVGVIMRPIDLTLEVRGNGIHEHYNPLEVEVLAQAHLEDKAEDNEVLLQYLLNICKKVIVRLIASADYKTITPVNVRRVLENKYDANLIGWSLPLNLYYLLNETTDPCL